MLRNVYASRYSLFSKYCFSFQVILIKFDLHPDRNISLLPQQPNTNHMKRKHAKSSYSCLVVMLNSTFVPRSMVDSRRTQKLYWFPIHVEQYIKFFRLYKKIICEKQDYETSLQIQLFPFFWRVALRCFPQIYRISSGKTLVQSSKTISSEYQKKIFSFSLISFKEQHPFVPLVYLNSWVRNIMKPRLCIVLWASVVSYNKRNGLVLLEKSFEFYCPFGSLHLLSQRLYNRVSQNIRELSFLYPKLCKTRFSTLFRSMFPFNRVNKKIIYVQNGQE